MNRGLLVLALVAASSSCRGERWGAPEKTGGAADDSLPPAAASVTPNSATTQGQPSQPGDTLATSVCRAGRDVGSLIDRARELADADGNGEVSRDEARSTMNFVLGGLFFRADENADGKVTAEEAKTARDELVAREPMLGVALEHARESTGKNPLEFAASLLNGDADQVLTIEAARAKARSSLERLFSEVDADRDGSISGKEAAAASLEGLRAVGHRAFTGADRNSDGFLSSDEFQDTVATSMQSVFEFADANKDGKLSENEAAEAMRAIGQRVGSMTPHPSG